MNIYSFSVALFSFGAILSTFFVLIKRKDEVAYRFLMFCISASGWGALWSVWMSQAHSYEITLFFGRLCHVFAAFIPITWFHFIATFLNKKAPTKYFYAFNYLLATFLAIFCATPLMISDLHSIIGLKYFVSPGALYHVFVAQFFGVVILGFYYVISSYSQSPKDVKTQLKYFLAANGMGFAIGGITILLVYKIPIPLIVVVAMPLYPFLMAVALIKYGLFDEQQITDAFQREKLTAIGIMAASLNHELRNPLYVAKGRVETQLDFAEQGISKMDEKAKSSFDIVNNQLKRALEIIERFSNFAKPPMQDKKEEIVVKDAFNDVFHLVSKEFETRNIKVNQIPTNGLTVKANRRQFEEILFNLTMNACHAMSSMNTLSLEGEGETPKELTFNASQPNGKVIVEISDNGPGIPKEDQKRIFDPFYTTKGKKGSGLGLYITKQLIERNGGKIKINSKVGKGTTFHLEFKR